ncbi:MAG: alpha/beta hydrolase [Ruminococcaceae bacterium]|nr:alpha/beta hydrolase [Oscillospiraceae bacterium]
MPHIRCKDLLLFYEEFGRGEPLLMLHSAFSRGILAFASQIQPFQGQYRCLIPDFRGHGRTRCQDLTWDSDRHAEDMIAFLDALGIERVHLMGYSMGANVGLYLAARYPHRVRSLIAIGASHEPTPANVEDYLPEPLLARGEHDFIEDMIVRHQEAHRGDLQTYLRVNAADWQLHPRLTEAEWQAITCPVLFISGEHDPFSDLPALQKHCPHALCHLVEDGSHRPHFVMEQGREINQRMLEFLDKQK